MAQALPWDDETENIIADLNPAISKKYNISLRSLLLNPTKYAEKKNITATVQGIKTDVTAYLNDLNASFKDEASKLRTELESANEQYKQVDGVIEGKAAAARVPYIKPLYLNRTAGEETIVVESYSSNLDALIGKLILASNYVADISARYKDYKLGSWLFSGDRNYVLTINPPDSPLIIIENSTRLLTQMLDSIIERFG